MHDEGVGNEMMVGKRKSEVLCVCSAGGCGLMSGGCGLMCCAVRARSSIITTTTCAGSEDEELWAKASRRRCGRGRGGGGMS